MNLRIGSLFKQKTKKELYIRVIEIEKESGFIIAIEFNGKGIAREHPKFFDYD